jgi:hypothetical protein
VLYRQQNRNYRTVTAVTVRYFKRTAVTVRLMADRTQGEFSFSVHASTIFIFSFFDLLLYSAKFEKFEQFLSKSVSRPLCFYILFRSPHMTEY